MYWYYLYTGPIYNYSRIVSGTVKGTIQGSLNAPQGGNV